MKKIVSFILVLVVVFALAGCKKKGENDFEYVGIQVYEPAYIAKEKGFFEANNVNFKLSVTLAGGSQVIQMISKGQVDGGITSLMALSNAVNAGEKAIGVTDLQSSVANEPLERFFIHKDKVPVGWNEFTDEEQAVWLSQQTIAINLMGSSFYYTWEYYFAKYNIKMEDVDIRYISFQDQLIAIKNNAVDVVSLMSPYSSKLLADESYYQITDAYKIFGVKQFSVVVVSSELAKKNPDLVRRFVKSIVEAMDWALENQEEAKEIISKYTGIEKQYILDYYWQPDGMIIMEDVEFWKNYLGHTNIDAEDIATNKYNERVRD